VKEATSLRQQGEEVPLHPAVAQQGVDRSSPYKIPMGRDVTYKIPPKLTMSILGNTIHNLLEDGHQ
jgi:hypothetical protein